MDKRKQLNVIRAKRKANQKQSNALYKEEIKLENDEQLLALEIAKEEKLFAGTWKCQISSNMSVIFYTVRLPKKKKLNEVFGNPSGHAVDVLVSASIKILLGAEISLNFLSLKEAFNFANNNGIVLDTNNLEDSIESLKKEKDLLDQEIERLNNILVSIPNKVKKVK